jgi:DNA repair exonuclease SbcCD ATPase subunit
MVFEHKQGKKLVRVTVTEAEAKRNADIESIPKLQDSIEKLNAQNDKLKENVETLGEISVEQNHLIEKLTIQLEAFKTRIRELEQDNKNLNELKEQVCDSGSVDCSNPNLEPEPCMMGSCEN